MYSQSRAGSPAPSVGTGFSYPAVLPNMDVLTGSRAVTTAADTAFAAVTMDTPPTTVRVLWIAITVTPLSTNFAGLAIVQIVLDANRVFDLMATFNTPAILPDAAGLFPKGLTAAPKINAECVTTQTQVTIHFGVVPQ